MAEEESHSSSSSIESSQVDIETLATQENSGVQCTHCGKYFRSDRGVRIHIARAHPTVHRDILVHKHKTLTSTNPLEDINQNITDETSKKAFDYNSELNKWKSKFTEHLSDIEFENTVEEFVTFLASAPALLPGPKHPAQKYYEKRKNNIAVSTQRSYKASSNPERATKRDREKRKAKYMYDLTQYYYYNQRRRAIRNVFCNETPACLLNEDILQTHFSGIFSKPNIHQRSEYPSKVTESEFLTENDLFSPVITKQDILNATQKISIDTASGPDHVIVRVIKNDTVSEIISKIATRMLTCSLVPKIFQKARTILIYKGGDVNNPSNWRPITICSVIRRVIERALDKLLRSYVTLHDNQRGFTSSPGTYINTSILEAVLQRVRTNREDACVVFLDIHKAFDNVGHDHLRRTLESLGVPTKLSNLIMALQEGNITQIQSSKRKTKPIQINRGVLQGSPLSPALFNIATDHIVEELSEKHLAEKYGFLLDKKQPNLTIMSFADDTVIFGKNPEAAIELVKIAINRFQEIGLSINASKSVSLTIKKGKLIEEALIINENSKIGSQRNGEAVRYLGVNFLNEMKLDSQATLDKLRNKIDTLAASPLLKADQKFTIMNTSVSPTLIYPLQVTPLNKIPQRFLIDADKILKSGAKEILQLPADVPDHMVYTDRKFKGLGLFRASWEAKLQHINICNKLRQANNGYINAIRNLDEECHRCLNDLDLDINEQIQSPHGSLPNARKVRQILRDKEVELWAKLPHKGKGVELFREYTPANKWMRDHQGLSCAEWREAIKMTANVCAVRSLPGRSQDNTLCRRCHREHETLAHVLGACPYGEVLRNHRHHTIRHMIANSMRDHGYSVYEEVSGLATDGSNRRIDMIAFLPSNKAGYILDPTIRFETHNGQPEEVDAEKKSIYEPTIDFYKNKYKLERISVHGLMIGARGTIPQHLVQVWDSFGLKRIRLQDMAISAIRGSIAILRNHLYTS